MWSEPKTDWVATDAFNIKDYNRIKNNLSYLYELADEYYPSYAEPPDLGGDKVRTDVYYAREFNALEEALEGIRDIFLIDIGEEQTFRPNDKLPDYEELNRLESATLRLYLMFEQTNRSIRTAFRASNVRGIR